MRIFFVFIFFTWCSISLRAQDTTHLSVLFLGDIMQHDSQISDAYNPHTKKYDYQPCFQFVKPFIQSVDVAIGNFELTLAGPPYRGYPQFSAPDELLVTLKDAGMDVLVTANNHCVDTGQKGLERTIKMLDSLSIPHAGTFVDEVSRLNEYPLILNKNGFKLALLNYTFSTNGLPVSKPNIVNMIDTASIHADIFKANTSKPDMVIVFLHWGIEYESSPSQRQIDIAEFCFSHGAQLVIGAHPHVIQPMEWRKEKNQLVAYSLGNFISGQRKRYTDGGSMITVDLEKVSFENDSSFTQIDTASYMLEWVYRTADAEKNYYILPLTTFENDSKGFIKDADSREAFKTFATDSRSLLNKKNINVAESLKKPVDPDVRYKVLFLTASKKETQNLISPRVDFETEIVEDPNGNLFYYSGDFLNITEARKHRYKISEAGYKDAAVIKFKNGKIEQDLRSE